MELKHIAAQVVALSLGAELVERTPADWQREAAQALGQGFLPKCPVNLGPLESWVAAERAAAREQVLAAADGLIIQAVRLRQTKGGTCTRRFYAPVPPDKILFAVPRELVWLLGLGPKRTMVAACKLAAERKPGELWHVKGGYKSLGERPGPRRPPPPARPLEATRTRLGLPVRRATPGSGSG